LVSKLVKYSEAQAPVPSGWVIDWVRDFCPWASWATEAAKETKCGTKVA